LSETGGSEVEQGLCCYNRAPSSSCIHPSLQLQASLTLLNSHPIPATIAALSLAPAAITDSQPLNDRELVLAVEAAQQCD